MKQRSLSVVIAILAAVVFQSDWLIQCLSRFTLADHASQSSSTSSDGLADIREDGVHVDEVAPFVLVVSPKDRLAAPDSEWLAAWLEKRTEWVREVFFRHGALIFRGFRIPDASAFERVALAINPDLQTVYLGTSPRSQINGTRYVHTAADFQPHRTVPVHLEMSFRDAPPRLQIFYANRLDHELGGETPLTDFQGVWETLRQDQEFRAKFEGQQVKYIRNNDDCAALSRVDPLVQKCWQEMFKGGNRSQVLQKCAEESFECSWAPDGRLTMSNSQPFVREHPVSRKQVWFNHINVLHKDSMAYDLERTAVCWGGLRGWWPLLLGLYYRGLFSVLGLMWSESDLGSATTFEDGSVFSAREFHKMKLAIWRNTLQQPYQLQDVVLVDNLRVGHGREIYLGPKEARSIMTAWSNEYPAKWFPAQSA